MSDSDPNLALVLARGYTYEKLLCGLGTSHPNARVSMFGFDNSDPVYAWNNKEWQSYGGKNVNPPDISRMRYRDEGINLVFHFPTLDVGATAEFDFAYVLSPDDLSACRIACPPTLCICACNLTYASVHCYSNRHGQLESYQNLTADGYYVW